MSNLKYFVTLMCVLLSNLKCQKCPQSHTQLSMQIPQYFYKKLFFLSVRWEL